VTQVLPDADIGPGNILEPARHGKWGLDIIDHCATGKNHCTGRTGTRMCFFSFSWYGAINEPVSTLAGNIGMIRERLGKYKQFQDVPVEVAEFSVLYDENHNRYYCGDGTEWSASWLASVVAVAWDMNIARIHQWATTTALDTAPDALGFEEVSSLMPEGMRTPYSHVLSMLEAMAGGERLRVETQETTAAEAATEDLSTVGAVASRKGDNVLVLLFNHKPGREKASPRQVSLIMNHYNDGNEGADEGAWEISEWLIDAEHSGFTRALQDDCVEAGLKMASADAPASAANIAESFGLDGVRLWRRNLAKYEALSRLHAVRTAEPLSSDRASGLKLTVTMPTHSVRFLRLKWMPAQNDG
jgi:xylan 1,4-beta-xylosidase